jgi:hypothetical protein
MTARRTNSILRPSVLAASGLLAAFGFLAAWKWWPHAESLHESVPGDPRLTFATPYRNVRPDVKYVGDEACAGCHPRETKTYRDHPMGRSLAPVRAAPVVERYDAAAKNPFEALGFRYEVERLGERVVHREKATDAQGRRIVDAEADIQFAVGSGARGRTYLINRDGFLFQSPITWYTQKEAWDLSPGFDRNHSHFGRPVPTDCLFCHSNRALEVADTYHRYRPPIFEGYAIGCERCHGPGELHVKRHESGAPADGADDTVVNPGRLEPALREAVCEQCHLQGVARILRRGRQDFEYRPGLPLHLFLAIFVKSETQGDAHKFVGQVEQMHASRCFQASKGRMGCISCHDPHVQPSAEKRVAHYHERCLRCHADQGCSLPVDARRQTSKDDNCLLCHMPTGESDIQHHSITDHRVPRRPQDAAKRGPMASARDDMPMVLFHQQLLPTSDPEAARDLGVALVERIERYPPPVRAELGRRALPRLEAALKTDPSDVTAADAWAHALWAVGRGEAAAAAFEVALNLAPERTLTLQWAAALALERKQPETAVAYLERANELNPWRHEFRYLLAEAQAQRGAWQESLEACQAALRLNPANLGARKLQVECYLAVGQLDKARAEFDRLLALHPPDAEALRRWFARRQER